MSASIFPIILPDPGQKEKVIQAPRKENGLPGRFLSTVKRWFLKLKAQKDPAYDLWFSAFKKQCRELGESGPFYKVLLKGYYLEGYTPEAAAKHYKNESGQAYQW